MRGLSGKKGTRESQQLDGYRGKDRSNSQMYKMAGNSIVVDVLEEIFRILLEVEE